MYLFLGKESSKRIINLENVNRITFNPSGGTTFYFGKDDSYSSSEMSHEDVRAALERYNKEKYGYNL